MKVIKLCLIALVVIKALYSKSQNCNFFKNEYYIIDNFIENKLVEDVDCFLDSNKITPYLIKYKKGTYNPYYGKIKGEKIYNGLIKIELNEKNSNNEFKPLQNLWIDTSYLKAYWSYPLNKSNNIDEMIQQYQDIIKLKEKNTCNYQEWGIENMLIEAQIDIGLAYYQNEIYIKAIIYLSNAIKDVKFNKNVHADAYALRAFAKYQLEDYYGAISDCNLYLENEKSGISEYLGINKNNLYEIYAMSLINIKKYDDALLILNQAINLYPNSGALYYRRSEVKFKLFDKNGCCNDLSKSGELGYEEAFEAIKKICNN